MSLPPHFSQCVNGNVSLGPNVSDIPVDKEYVPYNVCLRTETVYSWFFFFFLLRVVMVTVLFVFLKTEFSGILNGF